MARELTAIAGTLHPRQLNELLPTALIGVWRRRYARNTASHLRYYLKSLLRFLEPFGAPRITLPKLPPPAARTTIATPAELSALRAAAAPWMRLFLLLCSQLALRFNEAANVSTANWNKEAHTILVRRKGGKLRTLPTSPDIEILLAAAEGDPATPAIWLLKGQVNSPQTIRDTFAALKKRVGANPALTIHDLRRTTATQLLRDTHDVHAVQQLLGHDSLHATAHYLVAFNPQEMRRILEKLWTPGKDTIQ